MVQGLEEEGMERDGLMGTESQVYKRVLEMDGGDHYLAM